MNRRSFLSKLGFAAAAVVAAPQVLVPKEPDFMQAIIEMKPARTPLDIMLSKYEGVMIMESTAGHGYYSDYERENWMQFQEGVERTFLFGERSQPPYAQAGLWTSE